MKKIKLQGKQSGGDYMILDDDDYKKFGHLKFRKNTSGYADVWFQKKNTRAHILFIGKKTGYEIDHINNNRLDNRRANLRHVTRSQNRMNMRLYRNNKSGFKGVHHMKTYRNQNKGWRAHIQKDGNGINIGCFNSAIEAARAYNTKARELFGEFASLNNV